MSGELVGGLVDHGGRRGAGDRVELPALAPAQVAVTERAEQIVLEHLRVVADVDDDLPVGRVVGVHRVEGVPDRQVDPDDVARLSIAGEQTDPVAVVGVPAEREASGERQIEIDGARLVVHDRVAGGERHVVQHRHAERDVDRAAHPAIGCDHDVLDMIEPLTPGVDHGVHLAAVGVDLRVGGERARQRAEEVVAADGLELVGELDRAPAGFDHRPRAAGEPTDVGVRRHRAGVPVRTGDVRFATNVAHVLRADVAVAVPLGPALAEADAVHHAVAHEPVVRRRVDGGRRVGAVAQVPAAQLGRDLPVELVRELADDREVEGGDLLGDGPVVAGQVQAGVGHRHRVLLMCVHAPTVC